jgi:hypothetical protein
MLFNKEINDFIDNNNLWYNNGGEVKLLRDKQHIYVNENYYNELEFIDWIQRFYYVENTNIRKLFDLLMKYHPKYFI